MICSALRLVRVRQARAAPVKRRCRTRRARQRRLERREGEGRGGGRAVRELPAGGVAPEDRDGLVGEGARQPGARVCMDKVTLQTRAT